MSKKANAGVGIIVRKGITTVRAAKGAEAFEEARRMGRLDKHYIDLGWKSNLILYNVYGKSGNTRKAKEMIESILDVIAEDMDDKANCGRVEVIKEISEVFGG